MPVQLHYREAGTGEALILLHGLFGAGTNLNVLGREFASSFRVVQPDLRNHGASPHDPRMDYPAMAGDLLALLNQLQIRQSHLAGHSMGGKVAMTVALLHPERVTSLVVLDIAPVPYPPGHADIIDAAAGLPLDALGSRRDADAALARRIEDPALRGFILQNLRKHGSGYQWRLNWSVIRERLAEISGFPHFDTPYPGPALFLHGANSRYVQARNEPEIRRLFPAARISAVAGAGHWLHADQPSAVVATMREFLEKVG
ncbi:MAG: alpha/beta fold hydrolase [Gammaproteobacteria bacterium]|jgi:pimeloyl-ACP methyl ester carboxylesterase|nr:alpha/beta fold hydrolase [Gammaproteobacteria bacterium]